ncbi:unnamed protein product [Boreogadus saida]
MAMEGRPLSINNCGACASEQEPGCAILDDLLSFAANITVTTSSCRSMPTADLAPPWWNELPTDTRTADLALPWWNELPTDTRTADLAPPWWNELPTDTRTADTLIVLAPPRWNEHHTDTPPVLHHMLTTTHRVRLHLGPK